jgi:hypothetical protein
LIARATNLLTGSSPALDVRFLIPNFCIAEVFAVFEKYRWGRTWNKQVKPSHVLSKKEFKKARKEFAAAIHNGSKILQVMLDRYHVLCVDLISPINNAYKINRVRGGKPARDRAKNTTPASTYDMLVAAVAIWCAKQYGSAEFTLVTGDERLSDVIYRAKSGKRSKAMKAHLSVVAQTLGLNYGPELYPEVIDLAHSTKSELRARFPGWTPDW